MTGLEVQFEQVFGRKLESIREDQRSILSLCGQMLQEVMDSPEPIAMGVMWMGEADLLGDKQINWITNLSKAAFPRLIQHTYQRLKKRGDLP